MLRSLLLVLVTTVSSLSFAGTTDVTRVTEGFGATQQEAVANALVEAVRQVRGSAAGVDRSIAENVTLVAGDGGRVLVDKSSKPMPDVYTESRGFVRSYEVLEQRATEKGVYVRIRAVVPGFESAITDAGKKRVAVLPFRVSVEGFSLADHGSPAAFSQRLADRLVTQMAQADDVVVINRDFFAELGLEKAVLSADAAPEELTKLGASVGADFLLVGRVQEARTESQGSVYGSRPRQTDEIRLNWRMIEAATGKLLRAGDVRLDKPRRSRKNAYASNPRDDFEAGELFAALAVQVGEAALDQRPAPAAAAAKSETAPAEATPGSSDKPLSW